MTPVTGRPSAAVVLAAVDDSVAAVAVAVARAAGETPLTRGAQVVVFNAVGVLPEHRALAGLGWIDEPGSVGEDAEATLCLGRADARPARRELPDTGRRRRCARRGVGRARQIARAIQRADDGEAAALVVIGHTSSRRLARCSVAGRRLRRSTRDVLGVPVVPVTSLSPASDRTPPTLVPTPRSIP